MLPVVILRNYYDDWEQHSKELTSKLRKSYIFHIEFIL